MSYILNIETSTKNCSVSLSLNGNLISIKEIAEENYSHAEQLHHFFELVLQDVNISFKDLSAVAISKGPGSYTGLRIGVSAAKGLSFALNIPLISIDTLKILATQIVTENNYILPVLDARRLEMFCCVYDSNYEIIKPIEAHILNEKSFVEIKEPLIIIGDCIKKCQDILSLDNVQYIYSLPSSREMCGLSYEKYKVNELEDTAYFAPYYLKDFMINI